MITFAVIGDQIAGSIGEDHFSVKFDKATFDTLTSLAAEAAEVTSMDDYKVIADKARELTKNDIASVIESECKLIKINEKDGKLYLQHNGVLSAIPMPQALVDRILASQDKDIDYMPLVRMWVRFLRNPNINKKGKGARFAQKFFNFINMTYVHPKIKEDLIKEGFSDEVATERATMYQMKITNEGLLNGYKVSAEHTVKYEADENGKPVQKQRYLKTFDINTGEVTGDGLPETVEDRIFVPAMMGMSGDEFSCTGKNGFDKLGHFIKVGCTHALDSWDQVNTNDDQSCVKGLHFGGLYYINSISGHIHNIFVDPMNIGAVPDDTRGAIRCKEYFVHSSLAGVNGSIYHSSAYAKQTDAQFAEALDEAVKVRLEKEAKKKTAADQAESLTL